MATQANKRLKLLCSTTWVSTNNLSIKAMLAAKKNHPYWILTSTLIAENIVNSPFALQTDKLQIQSKEKELKALDIAQEYQQKWTYS